MVKWLKFETIDEAYNWARWMMDLHGLQDWKLEFRKLANKRGCCGNRFIHMNIEEATSIRMSHVMNTLLHEIAHALVFCKYEDPVSNAVAWMFENNKNLYEAADHTGIPLDDLRAYFRKGKNSKVKRVKPHDMIWAKQAVELGVCIPSDLEANKKVIRRAMADAGIKDYQRINERKLGAAVKAAKNGSASSHPKRPRT